MRHGLNRDGCEVQAITVVSNPAQLQRRERIRGETRSKSSASSRRKSSRSLQRRQIGIAAGFSGIMPPGGDCSF